jgi:hypothetical protein
VQRDALKKLVQQQAGQKVVGGEVLTGDHTAAAAVIAAAFLCSS